MYEELHEDGAAALAYEQAVRLKPDDALYWYSLGLTYQKLLLFDKAIHAHEQAVVLKPDYCEAWVRLGAIYAVESENTKVIDVYKKLKSLSCDQTDEFFRHFVLPN